MTDFQLIAQINSLPKDLRQEVADFVAFLQFKVKTEASVKQENIKQRKFGCAKGLISMKPNFEEPLDDFKE